MLRETLHRQAHRSELFPYLEAFLFFFLPFALPERTRAVPAGGIRLQAQRQVDVVGEPGEGELHRVSP